MIQPNELRIGNWLQTERGYFFKMEHIPDTKLGDYSRIYPIPLTPEILKKAGFVCVVDNHEWELRDHSFYIVKKALSNNLNNYRWMQTDLAYLHQLQNLYFALTGEELQIEL